MLFLTVILFLFLKSTIKLFDTLLNQSFWFLQKYPITNATCFLCSFHREILLNWYRACLCETEFIHDNTGKPSYLRVFSYKTKFHPIEKSILFNKNRVFFCIKLNISALHNKNLLIILLFFVRDHFRFPSQYFWNFRICQWKVKKFMTLKIFARASKLCNREILYFTWNRLIVF